MAYSSREHHDPGFVCKLDLGVTTGNDVYPSTVVNAVGRSCRDAYTIESGGKNSISQMGGYEAPDVYAQLLAFQGTHQIVEVTKAPSFDRLAPELGAIMASEVVEDADLILDGLASSDVRDAEVAATFDAAADQIVPRFDEA